ncbi:hypothetical protein [Sediminicola sp. 1XM1-17]|uniref:hypothetical protein n=1 Tax=Sediminicola sp. 1XM1-17 TaxID=3127702 RepID=UPI003077C303
MEHNVNTIEGAIGNLRQLLDQNSKVLISLEKDLNQIHKRLESLETKMESNATYSNDQIKTIASLSEHIKTHDEHLGLVNRNLELHHQYLALLNEKIS